MSLNDTSRANRIHIGIFGLKAYDLIIHCGACIFNRRLVMSRIAAACRAGVLMINYGIFLAKMNGILDRITLQKRVEKT